MPLWHFRSDVMKGFYASEVYASAGTKRGAIMFAGQAFDQYVKAYHEVIGYWPLIDDHFDEEGKAQEQLQEVRKQLLEEATEKFRFMGSAAILTRS